MPPKPIAPQVQIKNIPKELRPLTQWVMWRYFIRDGKWTKKPFMPSGCAAEADDPATWSTSAAVLSAYTETLHPQCKREYHFDGIGFEFANGYTGIDMDGCWEEEGKLSDYASDVLAMFPGAYFEKSPSGTGVHILVKGKVPAGVNDRKTGTEIYSEGRFFTFTGDVLPGSSPVIADCDDAVKALYNKLRPPKPKNERPATGSGLVGSDADIRAVAFQNPVNGHKIASLDSGNISGYVGKDGRPNRSGADMALCNHYAYYAGPNGHAQVDRLFRASGLFRAKWDEVHYSNGDTYGKRTVENAIAGCKEFYTPYVPKEKKQPGAKSVSDSSTNESASGDGNTAEEQSPDDGGIPFAEHRDAKGLPEYGSYQITAILGLQSEAPDTNRALAYRASVVYKDTLHHCKELGFIGWNGKHWQRDDPKSRTATAAKFVALSHNVREESARLFSLVADLVKGGRTNDAEAMQKAARAHLRHVKAVESEKFAQSSMVLACDALSVSPFVFDIRPFVVGFQNGTWDRGEWREHRREDYLLNLCPVEYDPNADRTEWNAVLDRITGGDTDFAQTLQDVAGYCLSGASHIRLLPWLYGPTGTGKGTYSELLLTVMGNQASSIDPEKLQDDSSRERLGADLWNRRIALCAEAGNQRLDPELLKTLSGGDSYPVRHLYCEKFDAKPTHVLLMVANDAPNMTAYDDALKDRVIALPFDHALKSGPPIPLSDGLRLEEVRKNPNSRLVRGFTAWIVEGLHRVCQRQDVHRAKCTIEATRKFWKDTDILSEFWDDWRIVATHYDTFGKPFQQPTDTRIIDQLKVGMLKAEVRKQYEIWCQQQGIRKPYSPKQWAAACKSRGLYESFASDGSRLWKIFELNTDFVKATTNTTNTTEVNPKNPIREENSTNRVFEKHVGSVSSVSKPDSAPVVDSDRTPFTWPDDDFEDPFPDEEAGE